VVTPAPPAASFTWDVVLLTVNFANTSTGDSTWAWAFGDGDTSTAQNPSHTYLAPGDYTVTLTVSGPGGPDDTATHTVSVAPLPTSSP
jgi:PKD repeat protein